MVTTEGLAKFIVETEFPEIPNDAVKEVKKSIIDGIGTALESTVRPIGRMITEFTEEMGGNPTARLIGSGVWTSPPNAAFANGILTHGADFDDDGTCDVGDSDDDNDGCADGDDDDAYDDGPDTDSDGTDDDCDGDDDNDGVADGADSHPLDNTQCSDTDGDSCEDCSSGSYDTSNDGADNDMDGACDATDPDDDNDGCLDGDDDDPLADGPVIQRASERALSSGTTLKSSLQMVGTVRKRVRCPLVLFTYANPVLAMGTAEFMTRAADVGVDGLLVLDLPIEEAEEVHGLAIASNIDPIFLLSPTTTRERIKRAADLGRGFLYAISRLGVTGQRDSMAEGVSAMIERIRQVTQRPIALGFGISQPEHVRQVGRLADAAVVGSGLVSRIAEVAARFTCTG